MEASLDDMGVDLFEGLHVFAFGEKKGERWASVLVFVLEEFVWGLGSLKNVKRSGGCGYK